MRSRGFTLIEMITVIVLFGIIGGVAAYMINNTLQHYADMERRDRLQTSARLAIERIVREVRQALPNSVCVFDGTGCNSPANMVYFIRTADAGAYQDQAGNYPDAVKSPLPVSPDSASQFDVVSGTGMNISAGQWVVVYNLSNNVYAPGNNRHQIDSLTTKDPDTSVAGDNITVIHFSGNVSFPTDSPARRFHVVENNATMFFVQNNQLFRATSTFASPETPINPSLLLENVQALNFRYDPGNPSRSGLLQIDLTVSDDGETINLVHETHVFNTP